MIGNEILLAIQDYVKRSHRANFLIKNECIIEPIQKRTNEFRNLDILNDEHLLTKAIHCITNHLQ